jgi:AmmeMemoRadiSam system protein A
MELTSLHNNPLHSHPLAETHRQTLIEVARTSIEHGLCHQQPQAVVPGEFPQELREVRATFVTLHHDGALRGCVGTLEATRPLIADVAYHAYAAAFSDPRFQPVSWHEVEDLSLHISILTPWERLHFDSEESLLVQLRPYVDGLILEYGTRRATFLPSVWESLSDPEEFLRQLKLKAGIAADRLSGSVCAYRYTAYSIP